jgi:hypothetical protein
MEFDNILGSAIRLRLQSEQTDMADNPHHISNGLHAGLKAPPVKNYGVSWIKTCPAGVDSGKPKGRRQRSNA